MTPPELPDDSSQWPGDPFALLGLARGAAAIEIKRAYTRLIKKYKPEHHPDEFRRIREAYESCTAQSHWFLDAPSTVVHADESALPPLATTKSDEAQRLWSLAVAGNLTDAYLPLVRLAEQEQDRPDLPLRLYWLLSLEPELDSARVRHDWLLNGLTRARLSGPAAELYRRELRVEPEAALYEPYHALLSADAPAYDKLIVAQYRLAAAGRSQSWGPIAADLRELSRCLPMADEASWLSYLATAWDWTVWDRPGPLYGLVKDELKKLQHLELPQSHFFDRIEEAKRSSKGWADRADAMLTPPWIRLVPAAWADGSFELADVKRAVSEVADDAGALLRFDRLQQEFGPSLAFALIRALDRLLCSRGTHAATFPPEWIRGLALRLPGGWQRDYEQLRGDLLEFLVNHCLHPEEFLAACENDPQQRIRTLMMTLRGDLSLKLAWLARSLAA